ncbi:hypothetical protein BpHYR1_028054 [Brachionus plicatilis]|uniref:Uncharacterized protein n=1 Tax=Brachionus plicatilis TaxID=10195 RepID=A0A3M7P625_BRAPC|nr:hypothetical protein BpHYR1_028054 [Brachionus plicatilis]
MLYLKMDFFFHTKNNCVVDCYGILLFFRLIVYWTQVRFITIHVNEMTVFWCEHIYWNHNKYG